VKVEPNLAAAAGRNLTLSLNNGVKSKNFGVKQNWCKKCKNLGVKKCKIFGLKNGLKISPS